MTDSLWQADTENFTIKTSTLLTQGNPLYHEQGATDNEVGNLV